MYEIKLQVDEFPDESVTLKVVAKLSVNTVFSDGNWIIVSIPQLSLVNTKSE